MDPTTSAVRVEATLRVLSRIGVILRVRARVHARSLLSVFPPNSRARPGSRCVRRPQWPKWAARSARRSSSFRGYCRVRSCETMRVCASDSVQKLIGFEAFASLRKLANQRRASMFSGCEPSAFPRLVTAFQMEEATESSEVFERIAWFYS